MPIRAEPVKCRHSGGPRVRRLHVLDSFRSLISLMSLLSSITGALLFGAVIPAWARFDGADEVPETHARRPRFSVEAASYLGSGGPQLVLSFAVPYRELFFQPEDNHYHAEFDLIMLLRQGGEQVNGDLWTERVDVTSYADTRSRSEAVRRIYPLRCAPGRYQAEVTVRERRAGRESRVEWKIDVPDYEALPLSISGLCATECSGSYPDSLSFPPSTWRMSRHFGEPLGPQCFVGEVYENGPSTPPVRLTWRLLGSRGEVVERGESELKAGRRTSFDIRPNLSALWLGTYTLEVNATGGPERARRRFTFFMEETGAALDTDPAQSLEMIGLIASKGEVKELKEAKAALERKDAWNRFWKRHDPTPDTEENEFKEEFFVRVRYANDHFSVLEPGWNSDRGTTYIRYGPPDQLETVPVPTDSHPYEVWTYEQPSRRFVFVDYEGFGRYEFYQPGRS